MAEGTSGAGGGGRGRKCMVKVAMGCTDIISVSIDCVSHSVMSDSCDRMDCSPPGSSVHGILQARILEWVAISSSRGSS